MARQLSVMTRVSLRDVRHAEEEIRRCEERWRKHSCQVVTAQEVREAERYIAVGRDEIRRRLSPAWLLRWLALQTYVLVRWSRVGSWGWFPGAAIAGTVAVAAAAVPLVILFNKQAPVLVGLVAAFLCASTPVAWLLARNSDGDLSAAVSLLRGRLAARRAELTALRQRVAGWERRLADLRRVGRIRHEFERAKQRHQNLVDLLNDRRYQLVHSGWRSLRDVPFERFVADVFTELGYSVRVTKRTGDQGVDLIVSGGRRVLAVQCKGYSGSVGNKAVQEVYAGMAHYGCDECVVVTNSAFTSGARDLARSVGCRLLDGRDIPDLIEGRIY